MKYKLLALDIDGTLMDKNGIISDEDINAISAVQRIGICVSLSTGRSLIGCRRVLEQMKLDGYHISFDGALVSDPHNGEELYTCPLSKEMAKQAIEYSHSNEVPLELYSSSRYYAEHESWSTNAHREFFHIEPNIIDFTGLEDRERFIKGGIVATNSEEEEKVREFCLHFKDVFNFTWARTPAYPGVAFVNVLAPEVSKGNALIALVEHLGIGLDDVMAIGDGHNDVSLLSTAGLGIAMGNALDELKEVADHITLDIDDNGVAVAIKKFIA